MIQRAERMYGVKPQLVNIILGAGQQMDFIVTSGVRTMAEQRALVAKGASKTLNSRHLTGDAVDLAVLDNGKVTWEFEAYRKLAEIVKAVARTHDVPITWGGDWKMRDGPHFELVWDMTKT